LSSVFLKFVKNFSNSNFGINFVAQDSILAYPFPFYKANIECWATLVTRRVS